MLQDELKLTPSSDTDSRRSRESVEPAGESKGVAGPRNYEQNAELTAIDGQQKEVMTRDSCTRMTPAATAVEPNINLRREELLKLLSVFEGELQARDEVIKILKSKSPDDPPNSDRYGLSSMPLQALQRDAASLDATGIDHVAEQTVRNLQKIIQHQKESYQKIMQTLLTAEQENQRLAAEMTEEKRKRQDYMSKSDDFVNLLEEEREKLKLSLQQEKELNERKEADINFQLKSCKNELAKLKSLSLVLMEERQKRVSELSEHKKKIADLESRLREAEIKWKESEVDICSEKDHSVQLENDLEMESDKFFQTQAEFNTKLNEEREKNVQLEEKMASLMQQLKKLQSVKRNLQKTDDRLWRIHEKLETEDKEHELLLEEVELLRERVKDMEEGEKIYIQAHGDSRDIKHMLEEETAMTRNLRSQLNKLQTQAKAQKHLRTSIEDIDFRFDELQLKFEFEKRKSNDMKDHLQKMKSRMMELDQHEKVFQESADTIKLMKEKAILLADQKKCCDDQVKFFIDKNHQLKSEIKSEKDKVTDITGKLIKESRKVLKIREELGQERQKYSTEIIHLQNKLKDAEKSLKDQHSNRQSQIEEANNRLRRQVLLLKKRLDELELESEAMNSKSPPLYSSKKSSPATGFQPSKKLTDVYRPETGRNKPSTHPETRAVSAITIAKDGQTGRPVINAMDEPGIKKLTINSAAESGKSGCRILQHPAVTTRASPVVKEDSKLIIGEDYHPTSKIWSSSLTRSSKVSPMEKRTSHKESGDSITPEIRKADPEEKKNISCQSNSKNDETERLSLTKQDSKIPESEVPQPCFRSFQAQKDFSELRKKWAAKLGK